MHRSHQNAILITPLRGVMYLKALPMNADGTCWRQWDPRQAVLQRDADMRFLVPRKRNHLWVQWAVCARLRDAGVGIYKYLMRLLHAETAIVDDGIWATVSMEVMGWWVRHWL